MNKVIITVLGHDQPGIVATVARVLFEQSCNIENVSQTILQTEFSGSFIVTLPPEVRQDQLHDIMIEELASMDMHVHIAPIAAAGQAPQSKGSEPFVITTKGLTAKALWPVSAPLSPVMVSISQTCRRSSKAATNPATIS